MHCRVHVHSTLCTNQVAGFKYIILIEMVKSLTKPRCLKLLTNLWCCWENGVWKVAEAERGSRSLYSCAYQLAMGRVLSLLPSIIFDRLYSGRGAHTKLRIHSAPLSNRHTDATSCAHLQLSPKCVKINTWLSDFLWDTNTSKKCCQTSHFFWVGLGTSSLVPRLSPPNREESLATLGGLNRGLPAMS